MQSVWIVTGMPWADLARTIVVTMFFGAPLMLSLVALLDAARRPQWSWALAERNQVMWMAMIMAGVLLLCGGLAVSGWYLWKIRPEIAAAEAGRVQPRRGNGNSRRGDQTGGPGDR